MMCCSSESQILNKQRKINLLRSYQCNNSNYSLAYLIMNLRSLKILSPHEEDRKEFMSQKQKSINGWEESQKIKLLKNFNSSTKIVKSTT